MAVLVVGGAGYIGSHMVAALMESGTQAIVLDSLVEGHKQAIWPGAKFYEGNMQDTALLDKIFTENAVDSVVHFAAFVVVSESMQNPAKYYENNLVATLNLLQAMLRHNVKKIIFSSTASVYGMAKEMPVTEETPTGPINPYGESKLAVEKVLKWFDVAYGMKHVVFRYFNVAGAHESGKIGEDHHPESHLLPNIIKVAQGKRPAMDLFGDDYPTPDGTCVRDYVHVMDLVDAHILGLKRLDTVGESALYNLGSGGGFSNKELIAEVKRVSGIDFPVNVKERRPGDPPTLVASSDKAKAELGWNPTRTNIENVIKTAWKWHEENPNGYSNSSFTPH